LSFALYISVSSVEAKVLPQAKKATGGSTAAKAPAKSTGAGFKCNSKGVVIVKRLRADKKAVYFSVCNLSKARSVTYSLVYQTNGVEQGVSGTLSSGAGNSATRELVFGTASSGVYRYHTNITNARIEVSVELASGKTVDKSYPIKL
jgi:hypothetical protein